jgi:hypothetical protein
MPPTATTHQAALRPVTSNHEDKVILSIVPFTFAYGSILKRSAFPIEALPDTFHDAILEIAAAIHLPVPQVAEGVLLNNIGAKPEAEGCHSIKIAVSAVHLPPNFAA